jgi:hypothetical protein
MEHTFIPNAFWQSYHLDAKVAMPSYAIALYPHSQVLGSRQQLIRLNQGSLLN